MTRQARRPPPSAKSILLLLLLAACGSSVSPPDGAPAANSVASVVPSMTAEATPTATPTVAPSATKRQTDISQLQGSWRITASTGKEASLVFAKRVGQTVTIVGDTFELPDDFDPTSLRVLRKTLLFKGEVGGSLALDLTHRGNFDRNEPAARDAEARLSPNSKGWSRIVLARVEGDTLTLAVEFPREPAPTDFTPSAQREIVTLLRVRP